MRQALLYRERRRAGAGGIEENFRRDETFCANLERRAIGEVHDALRGPRLELLFKVERDETLRLFHAPHELVPGGEGAGERGSGRPG